MTRPSVVDELVTVAADAMESVVDAQGSVTIDEVIEACFTLTEKVAGGMARRDTDPRRTMSHAATVSRGVKRLEALLLERFSTRH